MLGGGVVLGLIALPRFLRDRRNREERRAMRDERTSYDERFPGGGELYWRTDMHIMQVMGQLGKGSGIMCNSGRMRNGPGLRQEDGFLAASIDPDLGYREDEVRFGRPMVYSRWRR